jgi:transcriptional regulator with XRE-family HTH domain
MQTYAETLKAHLAKRENKVTDLAKAVGTFQPNITRYALGKRFPSADVARAIDTATNGAVPFTLWQAEFFAKAGIAA